MRLYKTGISDTIEGIRNSCFNVDKVYKAVNIENIVMNFIYVFRKIINIFGKNK